MNERTGANFVIFAPSGLQETPQSEEICYTSKATIRDDELKDMIAYAKELGLRVALKPTAKTEHGGRTSIFLMRMYPANQSGATGFLPTQNFSSIMLK